MAVTVTEEADVSVIRVGSTRSETTELGARNGVVLFPTSSATPTTYRPRLTAGQCVRLDYGRRASDWLRVRSRREGPFFGTSDLRLIRTRVTATHTEPQTGHGNIVHEPMNSPRAGLSYARRPQLQGVVS